MQNKVSGTLAGLGQEQSCGKTSPLSDSEHLDSSSGKPGGKVPVRQTHVKGTQLIPKSDQYVQKPSPMTAVARDILWHVSTKNAKVGAPATRHFTWKLVNALCSSTQANLWTSECKEALAQQLPLREHHRALLSHSMFVTMIGTLVARALAQGTSAGKEKLDLLSDRYYTRNLVCHDSSKTSVMEASTYLGIIAMYIEKRAADEREKKRALCYARTGGKQGTLSVIQFKHQYEKNPHHPQFFTRDVMNHFNLVEAIVDGLACIIERNNMHMDIGSWLDMYWAERFHGDNKLLAQNVLSAL
ncbi:hypothetical protein CRENBAI_018493 [Crenichthys baileyi]|uniref:Uncharacterized protein n=1 Tax=Crenichthys baileyi TaxID=28760 RepID=A0AAV9RX19_9TELE